MLKVFTSLFLLIRIYLKHIKLSVISTAERCLERMCFKQRFLSNPSQSIPSNPTLEQVSPHIWELQKHFRVQCIYFACNAIRLFFSENTFAWHWVEPGTAKYSRVQPDTTRHSWKDQPDTTRYSQVQCWKVPSCALFLEGRCFEDIKYDTDRDFGNLWQLLGGNLWQPSTTPSQKLKIRGATCINDAVFSEAIHIVTTFHRTVN